MKKVFFLTIMMLAMFGNMQAQTLIPEVITLSNLHVYPKDLGYFTAIPDSIIAVINQSTSYGYNDWRVPTIKEMALMKTNWDKIPGLANGTYMTSDGQRSGILRLVSTGKTFAEKQQEKSRKEAKTFIPDEKKPKKQDGQKQQGAEQKKQDEQKQQGTEQKKQDGQKQQGTEPKKQDGQKQQGTEQKKQEGQKQKNLTQTSATEKSGGTSQQSKQNTPPYAASARTWKFGNQTWSDAIHMPECNRESFAKSDTDPQCRSYTEGDITRYYYNWEYVSVNKDKMCPYPWRVPTREDFETLMENKSTGFPDIWGYGGRANGSAMENGIYYAYYWSSTEDGSQRAIQLKYASGGTTVERILKYYGHQVRCVK
jgi:hypothetical protein